MQTNEKQIHTFESIKTNFIERCKAASSCEPEFKRVLQSTDLKELLQVIRDNIEWSIRDGKVINSNELKEWFGVELCNEIGIYFDGHVKVYSKETIHFDSSTSEHYGSSTSKHFDSSTSEHYGSSTSKHFDSSTSKHFDSSTSKHFDSSTCYSTSENQILNNNSIRRNIFENKIYIKKGTSEIVYI